MRVRDTNTRVLLVETDESIRHLVRTILQQGGHEVAELDDGRDAVEAMERELFPCVVVGSPVVVEDDGSRRLLLEYIEERCPEWSARLIVITTHVDSRRVLDVAMRLEVCAVVAKPFSARDLLDTVASCLAGSTGPTRWIGIHDDLVPG